jgi:hypothetical protein
MAESNGGTPAAVAEPNVPDLQETAGNPEDVDRNPGDEIPADSNAVIPDGHCPGGATQDVWDAIHKPWAVTHQKGFENNTDSTTTYTKTASHEKTLEASFSGTWEGSGTGNVYVVELQGKTGYNLAAVGKFTNTGSESVTASMKPHKVYVFYAGARDTSSSFTHYACNSITWINIGKGKVRSFGMNREGAVQCGTKVDSSTLGYVVERDYC